MTAPAAQWLIKIQVIYHQKLWEILHTTFSIGDMDGAQLNGGWGMNGIAM